MESLVLKRVSLKDISEECPFRFRYTLEDPALQESIRKRGVLFPVVLGGSGPYAVIAGHKRVQAARAAGLPDVPALAGPPLDPKDGFIAALLSNWNQHLSDLDRMLAVKKAADLGFSAEETAAEIFPLLGIPQGRQFLEEAAAVTGLHPALLKLIGEERLPLRGAAALARFSPENQAVLASLIEEGMSLTASQLGTACGWLYDLLKVSGSGLAEYAESNGLRSIAAKKEWDGRLRGEKFMEALKGLKFPRVSRVEEAFSGCSTGITRGNPDLKIEATPFFEGEGFTLHARVRNPESLERILRLLQERRPQLNELFEIVL